MNVLYLSNGRVDVATGCSSGGGCVFLCDPWAIDGCIRFSVVICGAIDCSGYVVVTSALSDLTTIG
jgi:hypothetical protein